MKDEALRQQSLANKVTVSFAEEDLPPLRRLRQKPLCSFGVPINCAIALPADRVALAYDDDGDVRVFSTEDTSMPAVTVRLHATKVTDMAALGADIVASADCGGRVRTWNAATGALLDSHDVRAHRRMWTALCNAGSEIAVGDSNGNIHMLSHNRGFDVRPVRVMRGAHRRYISWLACHEDTLVAASDDWSASIWEQSTGRCLARLPHSYRVFCTAISKTHIATACGREVRLYRNGGDYGLLAVYRGLHSTFKCFAVALAGDDMLVTGGADALITYTSISEGRPVARSRTSVDSMTNIELIRDNRIVACSEWSEQSAIVRAPDTLQLEVKVSNEGTRAVVPRSKRREGNRARNVFVGVLLSTFAVMIRMRKCAK